MPVEPNYSVPSWLHGANPLQAVEAGASLGVRIAESNQRAAIAYAEMQRRQQEFQQQMEMAQQQLEKKQAFQQQQFQAEQQIAEQNQLRKDQQLQIENAYKQGQLGLAKQKLDMTAKAAAEKTNAEGKFLLTLNTLASGYMGEEGMTEEQARAKAFPIALQESGIFQYMNPSSLASMAKSVSDPRSGQWKRSPSGYPYFETAQGGLHFEPRPIPTVQLEDKERIKDATRDIVEIQKQLREVQSNTSLSDKDRQEKEIPIQERLYNAQAKRHKLFQKAQQQQAQAPDQTSEDVLALPKTKDQLVNGKKYNTSRGVAQWDGSQFIPVTEEPATTEASSDEE